MEEIGMRLIGNEHDIHEYHGLIFNMPAERIPVNLAREIVRVGSLDLWQYQAFVHHEHPAFGPENFEEELKLRDEWTELLSTRFPEHEFVIEIRPLDRMTWFQKTKTAPTEDDLEFQDYQPPISISGTELREMIAQSGKDLQKFKEIQSAGFKRKTPRKGANGACEKCWSTDGFTEPTVSKGHRGIRFMNCLNCGAELVHSTKTVRFLVNG